MSTGKRTDKNVMADDIHFKERLRTELENLGILAGTLGRLGELLDIVDAWVWGESGAVHDDFKAALVTVLMRMPREAVDYLVEGRILKCNEQAKRIYELCVVSAKAENTLTYAEVLDSLGYQQGVSGQAIRYGLELVLIACANMGLPILTSIVVNQSTGRPSDGGYPKDPWKKEVQSVFNHKEWPVMDEIDWKYVWNNRKQLSNKHGTSGYWSR